MSAADLRVVPAHGEKSRPALEAGFVAFITGVLAQIWSQHTGAVFAFWDAQAHLDIARRVVDSTTPGLQMLGTVWLPVPHLLLLPFTLVDAWWWSGLAGGLVGLAAFVATITAFHLMLVRRTDARLAWIGTALVLFNPSLLFLQTTAMTEPVLLAFLVGAAALLDHWNSSGRRSSLIWAGVLTALAIGTRYDGWFFAAIAVPAVAWLSWRHQRGWLRDALTFGLPCAFMGAAWLGFNWFYFGDPLEFQRGVWSAQAQAAALGALPDKGHLLASLWTYLGATVLTSGAVLTVAGLALLPAAVRPLRTSAPALLLLSVLPFNVLALLAGQSVVELPWGATPGILNLRYGVMMLPALAALVVMGAAFVLRRRPGWRGGMQLAGVTVVVLQLALFGVNWPANAGALREGLAIRDGDRRQQEASDWLATHFDGGRILVDEAVNLSPRTRIPLHDRIYQWTWQLGTEALKSPENAVDWVVVDRRHEKGKVLSAIDGREAFVNRFDRVFDQDGLEIWRRR